MSVLTGLDVTGNERYYSKGVRGWLQETWRTCLAILRQYRLVTDRRTDGQTDIHSRKVTMNGRNVKKGKNSSQRLIRRRNLVRNWTNWSK